MEESVGQDIAEMSSRRNSTMIYRANGASGWSLHRPWTHWNRSVGLSSVCRTRRATRRVHSSSTHVAIRFLRFLNGELYSLVNRDTKTKRAPISINVRAKRTPTEEKCRRGRVWLSVLDIETRVLFIHETVLSLLFLVYPAISVCNNNNMYT